MGFVSGYMLKTGQWHRCEPEVLGHIEGLETQLAEQTKEVELLRWYCKSRTVLEGRPLLDAIRDARAGEGKPENG